VLATFSILLWHFYMVIFDPSVYPMDRAWLTGKTPADHFRHSRPEYLLALEREQLMPTFSEDESLKEPAADSPCDLSEQSESTGLDRLTRRTP